jgi:uncharacterized membrane protein HdeD (DUF308 family)
MTEATDFVGAVIDEVRKFWRWFLVTGILAIVLGVLCIGTAQTATTLSILTLGWILVISATLWLTCALYTFGLRGIAQYLPNVIIRAVTGYLLISHPDVGALGVAVLLAALFIILGLFHALTASVYKFPRWEWAVLSGLVSFCLGVYLLYTWHTASTYLLGLLIGVDLIVNGTTLVGFAIAIHGGSHAVQRNAGI